MMSHPPRSETNHGEEGMGAKREGEEPPTEELTRIQYR